MITVTSVCKQLLYDDHIAMQAMAAGLLNFSAYAEQIHAQVETATFKTVKKGTLVVALSRLAKELQRSFILRPDVVVDDVSIKSALCDLTYSKTPENREKVSTLYQHITVPENAFFTVTQGTTEITIIAPEALLPVIKKHFNQKPKAIFIDRVGVTVRFSQEYLQVPNVLYVLQSALAVHEINFTEIISTYTEFSFIIEKQYLEVATKALQKFLP